MMKKWSVMLIAAVVCISMTGCGGSSAKIDIHAMTKEVSTKVTFQDNLAELDAGIVSMAYPNIVEGVTDSSVYMGSGATAEEIAVFEAKDENIAKEMLTAAKQHITDQKAAFESYIPEEIKKLEKAIVKQKGNYVVVCVTDDNANAEKTIDGYFK